MGNKGTAIFHEIEFLVNLVIDLERPGYPRLTTTVIHKREHARAQIAPYVLDGESGPVEAADLLFEDGAVTRRIRYTWFRFV